MMQRQVASDNYERSLLFHGTSEDNMDKIMAQGFNQFFGLSGTVREGKTSPRQMFVGAKSSMTTVNNLVRSDDLCHVPRFTSVP